MNNLFRKLFITKKRKLLAEEYLNVAKYWSMLAQEELTLYNKETVDYENYNENAKECKSKAAKYLGFRNVYEMYKYNTIHGKI